jgi:hypothetical protein
MSASHTRYAGVEMEISWAPARKQPFANGGYGNGMEKHLYYLANAEA